MKKKNAAFTLIEVLIAMIILSSAIVITTSVWGGNFLRIRKAKIQTTAALLLEQKILELEDQYKDEDIENIPDSQSGDFGQDYPNYIWNMKTLVPEIENLADLLRQDDGTSSDFLSILISTIQDGLSKSVKEMQVSVTYSIGSKSVTYSVTTLLISKKPHLSLEGF